MARIYGVLLAVYGVSNHRRTMKQIVNALSGT